MSVPSRGEVFSRATDAINTDVHFYLERHLGYKLEIDCLNGCWLFTGGSKNGFHGSLWIDGKSVQVHRYAWELTQGEIPNNLFVLHKCDVGMCVNPTHLFLGTQQDNIADMDAKGRSNRPQPGIKNGRAKLSVEDVKEIRRLASIGVAPVVIFRNYDVGLTTINKIIRREIWRHI